MWASAPAELGRSRRSGCRRDRRAFAVPPIDPQRSGSGAVAETLASISTNPHPTFQLATETSDNCQRSAHPDKTRQICAIPIRAAPVFRPNFPVRGNFCPQSAFSFGPCTARFLFGKTEKKMGGVFPTPQHGADPSPARGADPSQHPIFWREQPCHTTLHLSPWAAPRTR